MMHPLLRHFAIAGATIASLLASISLAQAEQGHVNAETGGVAIGRDVINSQIQIHDPPEVIERIVKSRIKPFEDLTEIQQEMIDRLKSDLALNGQQVQAALEILGAANVPPERLVAKLTEIAQQFKTLQKIAQTQSGDDAKIAALKEAARKAIDAGELAKADALLADVDAEQGKAVEKLQANRAETSAQRGEIALTRLRYAEAAKHFEPPRVCRRPFRSSHAAMAEASVCA
jgi:hypothetical protein